MLMRTRLTPLIGITLALAACGGSGDSVDADVMFAQMMIPHHEQAIELADIALDPTVGAGPEVLELAAQIKAAQDPEVEMMTSMLQAWGEPTYLDEGMDHSSMMSGMVPADDMAELESLRGADFDAAWLKAMIGHHEGAIDMANDVIEKGDDKATTDLARKIIDGQSAEIERMKALLGE
ncbi:MAG: DUF305 domain-containing protein [Acidimicrobiales bacterium mtb01]|nr:DUF305 domain-containing protein [Actinomycetota bacterium]TEX46468.1 MAG: DUF305 domain-containing protein [Acidimicrobiales bacterium mtb01]